MSRRHPARFRGSRRDMTSALFDLDPWRQLMAAMRDDAGRWHVFETAATELAALVPRGLDRTVAIDFLQETATTYNLVADTDHVQTIMADAFREVRQADYVPDLELPKGNGHDTTPTAQPIPTTIPFPIIGSSIPRRPWIVPGLLLRRQLTVLVAPPGSGKSLLTLQLGMVCAAGLSDWNGWRPRGPSRVLIINSEEDNDEMRRRLFAARIVMDIPEEFLTTLAMADSPEDIVVARADSRTKTVTRTPMLERIVATVLAQHFDIVIVDPFAETFAGDENSNSELKWAG